MLDVASLFAIFCAIQVIISKNPIVSALFLIGLFLSISGYLIMLGINFIGLSYLLVYVGAVEGKTPKNNHAALVKIQPHKVLLIIVSFYIVECKNIILSVINKCICAADSISVNHLTMISHYSSPPTPVPTLLGFALEKGGGVEGCEITYKSFCSTRTPCSVSPFLTSRDAMDYTEDEEYTKTNLQDVVFLN